MPILYMMLVYISVVVITLHNSLYSADHKEKKERTLHYSEKFDFDYVSTYEAYRKEGYYALTKLRQTVDNVFTLTTKHLALTTALQKSHKDAIQFYAQGLNIWPYYIEAIKTGAVDNVRILLPLMATKDTYPRYSFNNSDQELPINDCSGLVTAIEAKSLKTDEAKIALMKMIIDFYQPHTLKCGPSCCFSCTSHCNQRRATFIIYGLAKAGEHCLALKQSEDMQKYIYETCQAFVTKDALRILNTQGKTDLNQQFQERRLQQNREIQLLLAFNCFNTGSAYYHKIAQPVINNLRLGASSLSLWPQLCKKE